MKAKKPAPKSMTMGTLMGKKMPKQTKSAAPVKSPFQKMQKTVKLKQPY